MREMTSAQRWGGIALVVAASIAAIYLDIVVGAEDLAVKANVWSAFGTVAAVVVALFLAYLSQGHLRQATVARQRAAAILVSHRAYELRSILQALAEKEAAVRLNPTGYAHWLSTYSGRLKSMGPLIEDKHLPLVVDLPALDLFTLTVVDDWFAKLKERHLFDDGATVADVIDRFDALVSELMRGHALISTASARLYELSGVPGPAPWVKAPLPFWVEPVQPAPSLFAPAPRAR